MGEHVRTEYGGYVMGGWNDKLFSRGSGFPMPQVGDLLFGLCHLAITY